MIQPHRNALKSTFVPQHSRTPTASACSIIIRCKVVRRTPRPQLAGKLASTDAPRSMKRIPRNGNESEALNETPSLDSARRASGIRPSPHALSAGGTIPSATVTLKPLRRVAIAAARPAGPPPIIRMSAFTTATTPVQSRILVPSCSPRERFAPDKSSRGVGERKGSDAEVRLPERRSLNVEPLRLGSIVHVAHRIRTLALLISNLLMQEPRVTIRGSRGPE
jgi:hypothetical protein